MMEISIFKLLHKQSVSNTMPSSACLQVRTHDGANIFALVQLGDVVQVQLIVGYVVP